MAKQIHNTRCLFILMPRIYLYFGREHETVDDFCNSLTQNI